VNENQIKISDGQNVR